MRVNCNNIQFANNAIDIFNDLNHKIYAIDIYVTSTNADYLLDSALDSGVEGGYRFSLTIDGIEFPIMRGAPGESPLNPITYIKDANIAKFIFREPNTEEIDATCLVGSFLGGTWEYGTNIDNDDSVTLIFTQNTPSSDTDNLVGYGEYAYGYDADFIVGYGGMVVESSPGDLQIVAEESKLITKDLLYLYESLNPFAKEEQDIGISYNAYQPILYTLETGNIQNEQELIVDQFGDYLYLSK